MPSAWRWKRTTTTSTATRARRKDRSAPVRNFPQRTCVVCRTTTQKRELVRLVRGSGGEVQVDLTGQANGRGAYLCRTRSCWEQALRKGKLAGALRVNPIRPEDLETLRDFGLEQPDDEPVANAAAHEED